MKVEFYVKQIDDQQRTRDLFMFSDECPEMMVNKQIIHSNKKFQITSLEWINETPAELKAVCIEILN